MESRSLEVKWFSRLSNTFFSSAKSSEVFSSLWGLVSIKLNSDSTGLLTTNGDIEENSWV